MRMKAGSSVCLMQHALVCNMYLMSACVCKHGTHMHSRTHHAHMKCRMAYTCMHCMCSLTHAPTSARALQQSHHIYLNAHRRLVLLSRDGMRTEALHLQTTSRHGVCMQHARSTRSCNRRARVQMCGMFGHASRWFSFNCTIMMLVPTASSTGSCKCCALHGRMACAHRSVI